VGIAATRTCAGIALAEAKDMRLTSLLLLGSSLVACMRGSTDSVDTAESAIDSSDSVSAEGDVMTAAVDGADTTGLTALTAADVTARIAANIGARMLPAGCATVTQNAAVLTVEYNDCTGPRGLVHVTGTLVLAVSVALDGSITVHGTATSFEVNQAVLDIDATGTYSVAGTERTLVVSTNGSGTGPRGTTIDHQGNYTVQWDPTTECRSIVGSWETDLTRGTQSASRSNDVDLSRCAGGCPTGTLTHHFLGGASITVTFDGTATAQWTSSTGRSGTVALACR
jgi:hypothetical protein